MEITRKLVIDFRRLLSYQPTITAMVLVWMLLLLATPLLILIQWLPA